MKIKVMSVFGTRPEAIKMAPLIKELEGNANFENIVCTTGQHREMLDQVLKVFDISSDYDLNIMKDKQTLSTLTTSIVRRLEDIYCIEKPQVVIVHGDTTTTFCAALSAFYQKIDVVHVEAGLRSNDIYFPFPEEINRKLTTVLAKYHFTPTIVSELNLIKEGVPKENIHVVGNTVIDTIKYTVKNNYKFKDEILKNIDFSKKVVVVTAHRRENWGEVIVNVCNAIKKLSTRYADIQFLFLTHLNPVVKDCVVSILSNISNVFIMNPIGIDDCHNLLSRCFFVMTDSGGIQEEAPYLGKFVLVLRRETERKEVLDQGAIKLVGTDEKDIYDSAKNFIDVGGYNSNLSETVYGNGDASHKIVKLLEKMYLKNN